MFRSFDASTPPNLAPVGMNAALGYIGGNTPHVWTPAEWRRFANLKQAGIWVYGAGWDARQSAIDASLKLVALGFTPNATVRRFVVIDMETVDNDAWVETFATVMHDRGFDTVVYNSLSTGIETIPDVIGTWVAAWDGVSDIPAGTVAHQLADLGAYDVSVWEDSFSNRFGWGPRKG